ncbi:MAG: M48 family metalloprotease [Planctomycetota bacterium]|nr:M48 family metalloprotease [Planctomycetota bacterium]
MRAHFVLAVLLAPLAGCCRDKVNGEGYFCFGEISDAEEERLGAQYAPSFIAESGGLYPDEELNSYLRGIVIDKMARRSHRPHLNWKFHVLDSSQINAFALPGGQIFVTRGLIARLESEAQFAHLMGHEIGHVSHQHSVRGQSRGALFAILLGALTIAEDQLTDPDEPPLIATMVGAVGQLTLLKFSRDQELQSDRRGVDYALKAGYDPREGRKTFEMFLRVKREAGQQENLISGLLSTHPLDSRRIEGIKRYIDERHPDLSPDLTRSGSRWPAMLARLRRNHSVYEQHDRALALLARAQRDGNGSTLAEAEGLLRRCADQLPGHAAFHVGLSALLLEKKDLAAAERSLDEACRLDPDHFGARLYRGIVYRKTGRADAAVADLRRAHQVHGVHPLPCYLLGSLYEEKGDTVAAMDWFLRSVELSPRGTEIRRKSRAGLARVSHQTP